MPWCVLMGTRGDNPSFLMVKTKKKKIGKFNSVISCVSTSLVLILLGSATFFIKLSSNFERDLRDNFTVEVLLNDSITESERQLLETELTNLVYVSTVSYISKEEGAVEMAEVLEGGPQEFLGFNPIPAEFELYLRPEYANQDSLLNYLPDLYNHKFVSDVIYPRDAMEFVDKVIPMIGTVLVFIALLLGLISFALIHNTMRMSVYARRFSIHTMKLVGARWGLIRRPFILRAFWIGLWAAVIANVVLGAGMYGLYSLDSYFGDLVTDDVVWVTFGVNFACGLCLTILSAFISVNRFLRMSTNKLFMN